jgi:hypothetical protein
MKIHAIKSGRRSPSFCSRDRSSSRITEASADNAQFNGGDLSRSKTLNWRWVAA